MPESLDISKEPVLEDFQRQLYEEIADLEQTGNLTTGHFGNITPRMAQYFTAEDAEFFRKVTDPEYESRLTEEEVKDYKRRIEVFCGESANEQANQARSAMVSFVANRATKIFGFQDLGLPVPPLRKK